MVERETIIIRSMRRKYNWPEGPLNLWLIVMMAAGSVELGIFIYFMVVQSRLDLGIPWLFPFAISVGAITILFLGIILVLIQQRQLLPGIVVLGSFILFALFLTGLIETAIQLYGPRGSVNYYCNLYRPARGLRDGEATLAYLETLGICNDWKAAFAFWLVGCVFLLWMMVMSFQVNRNEFA